MTTPNSQDTRLDETDALPQEPVPSAGGDFVTIGFLAAFLVVFVTCWILGICEF